MCGFLGPRVCRYPSHTGAPMQERGPSQRHSVTKPTKYTSVMRDGLNSLVFGSRFVQVVVGPLSSGNAQFFFFDSCIPKFCVTVSAFLCPVRVLIFFTRERDVFALRLSVTRICLVIWPEHVFFASAHGVSSFHVSAVSILSFGGCFLFFFSNVR